MMKATTLICFAAAAVASPHELETRQSSKVATVDLAVSARRGTPNQLASGVLYGIPDQQGQIPDRFFTEPKLHYFRAGGAQMGRPGRGWHYNEYTPRFQSTLSNYKTARKYGGEFQMLPHDIWGTDSTNSSSKWPGDDGDWTNYEAFLDRLIADIKANNMIPGLKIDTWNEPNLSIFWKRSVDQWLEMWKRTYQKFRADPAVRSVPIVGPSMNVGPDPNNSWWDKFMKYIVANNVAPDEYTWHLLSGTTGQTNDLRFSVPAMNQFFASTGAPRRPFCVNEYINSGDERMNAAMAWHIARFEHYDTSGLRSNWLGGSGLHDFLAELIYRPNTGVAYQPNGAWQLYRYYAQSMTGVRLGSDGSSDGAFDVFATLSSDNVVHILAGVRAQTGTWQIQVKNMQALGFPASGEVSVKTLAFVDVGAQGVSNGPTDRGTQKINYSGGVLTLSVVQTGQDTKTAWAFEFQKA